MHIRITYLLAAFLIAGCTPPSPESAPVVLTPPTVAPVVLPPASPVTPPAPLSPLPTPTYQHPETQPETQSVTSETDAIYLLWLRQYETRRFQMSVRHREELEQINQRFTASETAFLPPRVDEIRREEEQFAATFNKRQPSPGCAALATAYGDIIAYMVRPRISAAEVNAALQKGDAAGIRQRLYAEQTRDPQGQQQSQRIDRANQELHAVCLSGQNLPSDACGWTIQP